MKRTTITLSDDLGVLVEEEAKRRQTSVSEVIRFALRETLVGSGKRRIPFAGICDDSKMTSGAEMEEALAEGWANALSRNRR